MDGDWPRVGPVSQFHSIFVHILFGVYLFYFLLIAGSNPVKFAYFFALDLRS
jgi:hypothetical protein